jgi:hypothetical protein
MTRKYLDSVEARLNQNAQFERQLKSKVKAAGCLVGFFWLSSVILSLALSLAVLTAVVAGAYFLCTGEFPIQ